MRCKVNYCFYNDGEFCSVDNIEIDEEGYCFELMILPQDADEIEE